MSCKSNCGYVFGVAAITFVLVLTKMKECSRKAACSLTVTASRLLIDPFAFCDFARDACFVDYRSAIRVFFCRNYKIRANIVCGYVYRRPFVRRAAGIMVISMLEYFRPNIVSKHIVISRGKDHYAPKDTRQGCSGSNG